MSGFLPKSPMLQLINWSIRFTVLQSLLFQVQRQLFFSADVAVPNFITCRQQRNLVLGTFHDYWRNKETNWLWELNGLKFNFPSNQQGQTGLEYLYLNRKQILLLYSLSVRGRVGGGRNCFYLLPWVPKDDCFSFPEQKPSTSTATTVVRIWTFSKGHQVEQIHLDFLFNLPASESIAWRTSEQTSYLLVAGFKFMAL